MSERIIESTLIKSISAPEAQLQYNIRLDKDAYQNLAKIESQIPKEKFSFYKTRLDTLIHHNIETALGERYNVELFQETYTIKDGQIYSQSFDEPFLGVLKRGQQFRLENGSEDLEREAAEVEGFIKMQRVMARRDTPDGQKAIMISPRGKPSSIYQHNFYDVFERQGNKVIMSRRTCQFSWQEFSKAAKIIDPYANLPKNPTDVDFKKNLITTSKSTHKIIQTFQPEKDTTSQKVYQQLLRACAPLISIYLNDISEGHFNAIVNFADIYLGKHHQIRDTQTIESIIKLSLEPVGQRQIMHTLSNLPTRSVKTPCGISGSSKITSKVSTLVPYSVADFAPGSSNYTEDQYGTLKIHCDECGSNYLRTPGILEKKCRNCGGTRGIVC